MKSAGQSAHTESGMKRSDKEELRVGQGLEVERQSGSTNVLLSLVGQVKSCVPLDAVGGEGTLIVSNDPRYVITVAILVGPKDEPLLRPGTDVALAIHSPTLLFGRDFTEVVAKKFTLRLHGTMSNGQRRFFHVDAEEVKGEKELSDNVK